MILGVVDSKEELHQSELVSFLNFWGWSDWWGRLTMLDACPTLCPLFQGGSLSQTANTRKYQSCSFLHTGVQWTMVLPSSSKTIRVAGLGQCCSLGQQRINDGKTLRKMEARKCEKKLPYIKWENTDILHKGWERTLHRPVWLLELYLSNCPACDRLQPNICIELVA